MDSNPRLPPPVATLLASAFPGRPVTGLAPTVGGFSNLSLRARIGAARCVVKAAEAPAKQADLRREASMLALLQGRRLSAPRPLAFAEGEGWSVLVTAWRPGLPGLRLYAEPPEALASPLTALGRALARLHRLALPPPADTGLLLATRAAELGASLETLPLPTDLRARLVEALAHPAWRPAAPCPVHGDAGLHNVLWSPGAFTLLDWELAGWGDPRLDLAWVAWTLRFRGLPSASWAALLAGYSPHEGLALDDEAIDALALGQVAGLLARAAGRPTWEEWLRRTRWTLEQARGLSHKLSYSE